MIIRRDLIQGSALWHSARAGLATASDLHKLVKLDWTPRKGDGVDTYVLTKAIEKYLGRPLQSFGSWATDQGNVLEEKAWPTLEFELGVTIERVGGIQMDDKKFWCSPDGLIWVDGWAGKVATGIGCEIKGLQPVNHARILPILDDGGAPEEYLPQAHGGMFVTGFQAWYFYAYSETLPTRIIKVERDENIQARIKEAVQICNARIDQCYARLCALRGVPPKSPCAANTATLPASPSEAEFREPADLWKGVGE